MKPFERKDVDTVSRRAVQFSRPTVHDNGAIQRLTAGNDTIDPEGDTDRCIDGVVRLRPRD